MIFGPLYLFILVVGLSAATTGKADVANTQFINQILNTQEISLEQRTELVAIALTECGGRHKTCPLGKVGEFGGFQLHPKYHNKGALINDTKKYILYTADLVQKIKQICRSKYNADWVICYNLGPTGSKRIRYPKKFLYYTRYQKNYLQASKYVLMYEQRQRYMFALGDYLK